MKSTTKMMVVAIVLLVAAAAFVAPAAARQITINNITNNDVVFVYETGLNFSLAGNLTDVGYMPTSLRKFTDDDPAKAMINDIPFGTGNAQTNWTLLDITSALVNGQYGIYYLYNASDPGVLSATGLKSIQIKAPSVALDVVLADSHKDSVNGKTVTKDNNLAFKITAADVGSYYKNSSWGNAASTYWYPATVKIEFTLPDGGVSTTLNQSFATVYVNASQFYTDATAQPGICYLDHAEIQTGEYSAVAKWVNPSGFADFAPASSAVTFTVASKGVTLTANKDTVIRGNPFTVSISGQSNAEYFVYIKTASLTQNEYPRLYPNQPGVGVTVANLRSADANTTITNELAKSGAIVINDTVAVVTTKADGTRTVQFNTNGTTKDREFELKVAKANDPGQVYDTVKVKVEKGAVTIAYAGAGTYYLGEEVELSGTNTDSANIYLFLTGPNLATNGVKLADSYFSASNGVAATFSSKTVETDDTWTFKWDTGSTNLTLDAGTYTIYAAAATYNKGSLSSTKYATASVILKKPFVNAQISQSTLAKGDKLIVTGTAEGSPSSIYIWIFGKNYRNMYNTQSVNTDGSFEYKLERSDTTSLAAGQYFLVVQHPMMNKIADVVSISSDKVTVLAGTSAVYITNNTLTAGGTAENLGLIKLTGLQASDAATALIDALNSPDIDDTYRKLTFMVEEPWIRIDTIGDKYVGDTFELTGTTNLAADDELLIEVRSSSFTPTEKTQSEAFSGASGTVTVAQGDAYNTWTFSVDATAFKPDEYIVLIESVDVTSATATTTFNVIEAPATTAAPTGTATAAPTGTATAAPTATATATPTPGFGAFVALIGLGAVAVLVLRRH